VKSTEKSTNQILGEIKYIKYFKAVEKLKGGALEH
jgi:hypothetical protein